MFYFGSSPFTLAPILNVPILKVGSIRFACLFVVAGLLAPFGAFATGTQIDLRHEVQWGNVNVGEVETSWLFDQTTFEMVGKSRTVGISEKLRKYRGNSTAKGHIHDNRHMPVQIDINGIYKGMERNATAIWNPKNGRIRTVRTPSLNLKKVHPLDDKVIQGSIDPYTAMLRALHTIKQTGSCNSSHNIYDGLRTAELTLHDLEDDLRPNFLTADRPDAYDGAVIACGLTSKPTGGHQLKSRWNKKKRNIDDTIIFIAEIEPDIFLPVRIEIKTFLGTITTRLVMTSLSIKNS
ncbi:DUF3108 domain-containing protein [Candidatus Puniceispirillum marinum]|nr:DUF3108 domain-containing protein [Candidatus Puniceispirillum marinum]